MRRVSYRSYFLLAILFLCVLCLPQGASQRLRSVAVCSFSPCWRGFNFLREQSLVLLTIPFSSKIATPYEKQEFERLCQENLLLRSQMDGVREWLLNEERLQAQLQRYQALQGQKDDFFKRRGLELGEELKLQLASLPSKIIFREPASWSSSVWINVGEKHNRKLGKTVVGKNSPVVLGSSLVGVVEYVGESQSRVRLITDASLVTSVRVVRGEEQNRPLVAMIDSLLFSLQARTELLNTEEERQKTLLLLSQIRKNLLKQTGDLYLAKGELKGSNAPLWRSRHSLLKGVGFNYDFSDQEGPARDLRSGEPYGLARNVPGVHLLQEGDLLVTSGLDGLFPAGLHVATVSFVQMLKEGASSYEIQAIPTAGNLEELSHVFVLPPYTH